MPPSVIVPLVVIGEPVAVNPVVPPLNATDVTVPPASVEANVPPLKVKPLPTVTEDKSPFESAYIIASVILCLIVPTTMLSPLE